MGEMVEGRLERLDKLSMPRRGAVLSIRSIRGLETLRGYALRPFDYVLAKSGELRQSR